MSDRREISFEKEFMDKEADAKKPAKKESRDKGKDGRKAAETGLSRHEAQEKASAQYYRDLENGIEHDELIARFVDANPDSPEAICRILTDMNFEMPDSVGAAYEGLGPMAPAGPEAFAHAAFFEWFRANYEDADAVWDAIDYNFNDELPRVLAFGEWAHARLYVGVRGMDVLEAFEETPAFKDDVRKVVEYAEGFEQSIFDFSVTDCDEVEADEYVATGSAVGEEIASMARDTAIADLADLYETGGRFLLAFINDGEVVVNGFVVDRGRIGNMEMKELRQCLGVAIAMGGDLAEVISMADPKRSTLKFDK